MVKKGGVKSVKNVATLVNVKSVKSVKMGGCPKVGVSKIDKTGGQKWPFCSMSKMTKNDQILDILKMQLFYFFTKM